VGSRLGVSCVGCWVLVGGDGDDGYDGDDWDDGYDVADGWMLCPVAKGDGWRRQFESHTYTYVCMDGRGHEALSRTAEEETIGTLASARVRVYNTRVQFYTSPPSLSSHSIPPLPPIICIHIHASSPFPHISRLDNRSPSWSDLHLSESGGPLVLELGVEHVAAADGGDVVA